ncbi:MAG: NAD(P)/FAD-dependent oxidoreductase, partial [Candidatus Woesearchaeota archaeon]|nr:NAD(P)/FAD-dependent oxidoreductase [Candidatus Woesearchaeota archaeon]
MRISIIGGGPSGSVTAHDLAKEGHEVTLFEENAEVGIPCHCTGIVTNVLWEHIPKNKDLILNQLKSVRIHASTGVHIDVPLSEFVLDRTGLDKYLAERAQDAGVLIKSEHRFIGLKNNTPIFNRPDSSIKKPDILIGADGPRSAVANSTGIFGERKFYFGVQATATGDFIPDRFEVWFGNVCPGFFAWLVPESDSVARIGIAALQSPQKYFQPFIKNRVKKILSHQGGPIPWFNNSLKQFIVHNTLPTYLVGDAGGLVKATTGGGIITGIMSGQLCARAINQNKNYLELLLPLKRELRLHGFMRTTLNKFS